MKWKYPVQIETNTLIFVTEMLRAVFEMFAIICNDVLYPSYVNLTLIIIHFQK